MIERSRDCAEHAADMLERTVVLHGDGLDMDILEEANLVAADALLAVTDDDKTNLLACARAKAAGCPMVVALINRFGEDKLIALIASMNAGLSLDEAFQETYAISYKEATVALTEHPAKL